MTDTIVEAEVTPAALSDQLQGIARRYVDARRRANESTLEAAQALAEARAAAQHGEWYTFLQATNTSEDLADRLLAISAEAQRSPQFAETVARGWLPMSQAALVARPSTPPEVKQQVIAEAERRAAQQQPPPSKREVEQTIAAARPAPPPRPAPTNPAPVRDMPAPQPLAPLPAPLTPLPGLAPLPALAELPPATALDSAEEIAAAAADRTELHRAEALIALLDQALTLAQSERDRVARALGHAEVRFPDASVELAARTFVASPAVRSAAAFLAMSAQEVR